MSPKHLIALLVVSLILSPWVDGHKGGKRHHEKPSKSTDHPGNKSDDSKGDRPHCKLELPSGQTYDFSRLARRSFNATSVSNDTVSFGFCRNMGDFEDAPLECPKEAGACRRHQGRVENAGQLNANKEPIWNLFEDGIIMSFTHGDVCLRDGENATSTESTHVQMTCDHAVKFKVDSIEMNACETIIKARSRHACPPTAVHWAGRGQHHRIRRPLVLGGIIALTLLMACCMGVCCACLIRRRQRQRRAAISFEQGQPQMTIPVFSSEVMHAMYPNVEMYPMANQNIPSMVAGTDEELARKLQAQFDQEM
eukprot:TRINITY_DN19438_c0_g1_i1.p1 TRINITY_DN19438_c0_g1~~TRINITY_DN19438_c0_g1_i1.p1  ORF type:complete len:309 (-),score=51.47 TRINITY_DN19438_c0_g1_i1:83-1009(-)